MLETTMPNLALVQHRSKAAGLWTAEAAAFFARHPDQCLDFGVDHGTLYVQATDARSGQHTLGGHARLTHHGCLAPDSLAPFLVAPIGSVSFRLTGPHSPDSGPILRGRVDVAQGRTEFYLHSGYDWATCAQVVALIATATSDTTPFHRAMLYGLLGAGTGGGMVYVDSVPQQMRDAAGAVAAGRLVPNTRLVLPPLPDGTTKHGLEQTLLSMVQATTWPAQAPWRVSCTDTDTVV